MGRRLLVAVVAGLALAAAPQAVAKAPTAVTGPATSVGGTSATVTGSVDPGGEATSWYVEYGTNDLVRLPYGDAGARATARSSSTSRSS